MKEATVDSLPMLFPRRVESHKGNFGHALVIGGSLGMAGAVALAARAALRMGAGLVTQAVPRCCLDVVAMLNPSAMSLPLAEDDQGRLDGAALAKLQSWYGKATAMGLGPGLGQSPGAKLVVRALVNTAPCPVVVDADALNLLADETDWCIDAKAPRILTPHPGEWARLCGVPASDRPGQSEAAIAIAKERRLVIVLKGHKTLVTDGTHSVLNTTGTPAMATGGSGDVLTGIVVGLLCQGLVPLDAAQLGVYLHGLAGQIAARQQDSHVVLPQELIDRIPHALRFIQSSAEAVDE